MYNYQTERSHLFTEDGLNLVIMARDNAQNLIKLAGAAKMSKLMSGISGDTWKTMAAIDYLVERGELKEITAPNSVAGQDRVFINPNESFYR